MNRISSPKQIVVLAQLSAAALLLLTVAMACTTKTIAEDEMAGANAGGNSATGHAGRAGAAAGHSTTNEGGDAGAAGETGAGNTGGGAQGGMSGGSSTGGTGGGSAAVCGNSMVEAGEDCDDGNTKDGDGCSSTCTNTCEKCEQAYCAKSVDVGPPFQYCFDDNNPVGKMPAVDGPATGTPKSQLCQALVACARRTKCAEAGSIIGPCFCGTANAADCKKDSGPNGPCVDEVAAAAESRDTDLMQQHAIKTIYALGMANAVLFDCDASACSRECHQGKTSTDCQRCALGPAPVLDTHTCGAYATCYFDPKYRDTCAPAVDCALTTGCGIRGAVACYGGGTGPCAKEFAAAAQSTDPATVIKNLIAMVDGPAQLATATLACEAGAIDADGGVNNMACQGTCFPNATTCDKCAVFSQNPHNSGACTRVVDCAAAKSCTTFESCYGNGTGPCSSQIDAASLAGKPWFEANVTSVNGKLVCNFSSCATQCGAGGSASGGSAGANPSAGGGPGGGGSGGGL